MSTSIKTRLSVASAGAVVAVLAMPVAAHAQLFTIQNPTHGATAVLDTTFANKVIACDDANDTHSAVTQISNSATSGTVTFEVRNPNGNGTCKDREIAAYSGSRNKYMRACLADGAGAVYSCSGWKAVTLL